MYIHALRHLGLVQPRLVDPAARWEYRSLREVAMWQLGCSKPCSPKKDWYSLYFTRKASFQIAGFLTQCKAKALDQQRCIQGT